MGAPKNGLMASVLFAEMSGSPLNYAQHACSKGGAKENVGVGFDEM